MDTLSLIATGIFTLVAAGWIVCAFVSVVVDARGGLVAWRSRTSA